MRLSYRAAIAPLLLLGAMEVGCAGNEAPRFSKDPSAAAESVASGAPVQLSAEATDPDGDALRYAWTQEPAEPAGSFSDAAAPAPTWTAPQVTQDTPFKLVVRVSDAESASVQGQATVQVLKPAPVNQAPAVTEAASATPTPVTGQATVQLAVMTTDADGDTLSYAWTQVSPASPTGSFSSTTVRNPTWTPPAVTAAQLFTLRVVVSDGKGGSAQSEVEVEARPEPQQNNAAPVLADPTPSSASVRAGDEVTLSASATDPDGDTLSYSWAQATPSTQGTFSAGQATAQAKWFSPPVSADTDFTFNVTVSDGKGGSATKPVTVRVTVPKFAADIQPVFSVCTGCHKATAPSGGMSLVQGVSYSNLVNVQANAACSVTMMRVKPSDPANSALINKVSGTDCGTRMPRNNQTYFDSRPGEIVRLRSWILAGANND